MKFLFVLTIVAAIVGAVFAYMNRQTFVTARTAKDAENSKINVAKAELTELIDETTVMIDDRKKIESERDEQKEILASAERKLATLKMDLSAEQSKLAAQQATYKGYEDKFKELPPGVDPATLNEDIDRLKTTLADKNTEMASLDKEIGIMQDNLTRNGRTLTNHKERQTERTKSFDVNSLEAIVTAVNSEWGFVLVNAGSNAGIRPDSSLLVVRDDQPVGKLRIISLEQNRLVADIDQKASLGTKVLPGDEVHLEKPNNG